MLHSEEYWCLLCTPRAISRGLMIWMYMYQYVSIHLCTHPPLIKAEQRHEAALMEAERIIVEHQKQQELAFEKKLQNAVAAVAAEHDKQVASETAELNAKRDLARREDQEKNDSLQQEIELLKKEVDTLNTRQAEDEFEREEAEEGSAREIEEMQIRLARAEQDREAALKAKAEAETAAAAAEGAAAKAQSMVEELWSAKKVSPPKVPTATDASSDSDDEPVPIPRKRAQSGSTSSSVGANPGRNAAGTAKQQDREPRLDDVLAAKDANLGTEVDLAQLRGVWGLLCSIDNQAASIETGGENFLVLDGDESGDDSASTGTSTSSSGDGSFIDAQALFDAANEEDVGSSKTNNTGNGVENTENSQDQNTHPRPPGQNEAEAGNDESTHKEGVHNKRKIAAQLKALRNEMRRLVLSQAYISVVSAQKSAQQQATGSDGSSASAVKGGFDNLEKSLRERADLANRQSAAQHAATVKVLKQEIERLTRANINSTKSQVIMTLEMDA